MRAATDVVGRSQCMQPLTSVFMCVLQLCANSPTLEHRCWCRWQSTQHGAVRMPSPSSSWQLWGTTRCFRCCTSHASGRSRRDLLSSLFSVSAFCNPLDCLCLGSALISRHHLFIQGVAHELLLRASASRPGTLGCAYSLLRISVCLLNSFPYRDISRACITGSVQAAAI